jgi:ATP-binding cassette subfamily B protein
LNKKKQVLLRNLHNVWKVINSRQKKKFIWLIFFSIITSIFEVIGIGALFPFLGLLANPNAFFQNPNLNHYFLLAGFNSPNQLILPFTILFILSSILSGLMRSLLFWHTTQFTFKTCAELSAEIYSRTIKQPYHIHIARNSSEVIGAVVNQSNSFIYEIVLPLMIFISSLIMISIVIGTLILFEPILAIGLFIILGLIYSLVSLITKKKILRNNKILEGKYAYLIKSVQEGLGSIRDIIISGSNAAYLKVYQDANIPLREIQAQNTFIANGPRYLIEAFGMSLIAILAFFLVQDSHLGVGLTLPFLGVIALSTQRLLPLFQQSYASWTSINGAQETLSIVLSYLLQPLNLESDNKKEFDFNRTIILKNLSFSYPSSKEIILNNINLTIRKGSKIGVIGKTGSGKSTLVDVIMGLLPPTSGSIELDGCQLSFSEMRLLQKNIAHVPQFIFLSDATVAENIAFGMPQNLVDMEKVRLAAKKARISDFIESWPAGYGEKIGERGVRLSGGQRQRVGIARALYNQSSLIVFDEATSALDVETEAEIMETIYSLDSQTTCLIVSHRLSTLSKCSSIIELSNGTIINSN